MNLRETLLPPGWYPRDREKIKEFLEPFAESGAFSRAAAAPHAGWRYSGYTAALAVSSLDREAETVVVIGGHLPPGAPVLAAAEDGVKTPLGSMNIDRELREAFEKRVLTRADNYRDNTVEVLLPMVRYFFPRAELLWLRFPAELSSYEAGKIIAESARDIGRRTVLLASTDLTHYGENYGFAPRGRGKPALEWVKKVNDDAFIAAALEAAPLKVLERAERDFSACSAGAVLGALGFAASRESAAPDNSPPEKSPRRLLDYRTSADAECFEGDEIPASFVGYAAILLG